MKNKITLLISFLFFAGCVGGGHSYLTTIKRDSHFHFKIISPPPHIGSVTLPDDPNAWAEVGRQAGWHSFENHQNNDSAQYVNGDLKDWEFYSPDLNTNKKFLSKYYEWENEFLSNHSLVDRTEIIQTSINEDDEDYIFIEVFRNDNIRHFIVMSVQKDRSIGVALRSNDTREIALSKVKAIYESTKGR